MKILSISASPNGANSLSRKAAATLLERLSHAHPDLKISHRDLATDPLPHVGPELLSAYFTPTTDRSQDLRRAIAPSDALVDELLGTDVLVISTPMWNFSIPSTLKAWIDHIVRSGRTFTFGPNGLESLVKGKKAFIIIASGSVFSSGPFAEMDFASNYLKAVLGFIGITEIELIRVEGTNDPKHAALALANADRKIEALVS